MNAATREADPVAITDQDPDSPPEKKPDPTLKKDWIRIKSSKNNKDLSMTLEKNTDPNE